MSTVSGGKDMPHDTGMRQELEVPNNMTREEQLKKICEARSLRVDQSNKYDLRAKITAQDILLSWKGWKWANEKERLHEQEVTDSLQILRREFGATMIKKDLWTVSGLCTNINDLEPLTVKTVNADQQQAIKEVPCSVKSKPCHKNSTKMAISQPMNSKMAPSDMSTSSLSPKDKCFDLNSGGGQTTPPTPLSSTSVGSLHDGFGISSTHSRQENKLEMERNSTKPLATHGASLKRAQNQIAGTSREISTSLQSTGSHSTAEEEKGARLKDLQPVQVQTERPSVPLNLGILNTLQGNFQDPIFLPQTDRDLQPQQLHGNDNDNWAWEETKEMKSQQEAQNKSNQTIDGNKDKEHTHFSCFGPPLTRPMVSSRLQGSSQIVQNNEFQGPASQCFQWPLHNGIQGPPPQVFQLSCYNGLQGFPSQGFQSSQYNLVQPQPPQIIQAPYHGQFQGQAPQLFQYNHQRPPSQGFRHPQYNDFQEKASQIYKSPYPSRFQGQPPQGFQDPHHNDSEEQASQIFQLPHQGPLTQGFRHPQQNNFQGQASQILQSPYQGPSSQGLRQPQHDNFQGQALQTSQSAHQGLPSQGLQPPRRNGYDRNNLAQVQAQGLSLALAVQNQPFGLQGQPYQGTRASRQHGYEQNPSPFSQTSHLNGLHMLTVTPRELVLRSIERDDEDICGRRVKRVKRVKGEMQNPIIISSEEEIEPRGETIAGVQNTVTLSSADEATVNNEAAFAMEAVVTDTTRPAPPFDRSAKSNGGANAAITHEALIFDSGPNTDELAIMVDRKDLQKAVRTKLHSDEPIFKNVSENIYSFARTSNSEIAAIASLSPPTLTSATTTTAAVPNVSGVDSSPQGSIMLNPEFAGSGPIWCPADSESSEIDQALAQFHYSEDARIEAEKFLYFWPYETLPCENKGQSSEGEMQRDLNEDDYLEMQSASTALSKNN